MLLQQQVQNEESDDEDEEEQELEEDPDSAMPGHKEKIVKTSQLRIDKIMRQALQTAR